MRNDSLFITPPPSTFVIVHQVGTNFVGAKWVDDKSSEEIKKILFSFRRCYGGRFWAIFDKESHHISTVPQAQNDFFLPDKNSMKTRFHWLMAFFGIFFDFSNEKQRRKEEKHQKKQPRLAFNSSSTNLRRKVLDYFGNQLSLDLN